MVLLCIGSFACHDGPALLSVDTTAMFDQAALDFGEVPVGEWREAEIVVRNAGYVPFTVVEALKLDDNPSFHVESGSQMVPAGDARRVKVRFHPLREGALQSQVKVETDAKWRPEDPIFLLGVGTPTPIRVEPSDLDFETLEVESDRSLELTIFNPVDIPLSVRLHQEDLGEFSTDAINIPPHGQVRVQARFSPRSLGHRFAQVEVRACEDCSAKVVALRGRSVHSAFEFLPAPVPFDETPVHERTQSFTRMTNVTWRAVDVTELVTSDAAFSPLADLRGLQIAPGTTVQLPLEFAARFAGPNVGTLDVRYLSDKDRASQVVLDARGGRPLLALTPIDIDFGSLPVGGKTGRTVRLTNAGANGPLFFQGVNGHGAAEHFGASGPRRHGQQFPWRTGSVWPQLRSDDLEIGPGADYLDVELYFQPTAAGGFEATIGFLTDDMFNPERVVTVRGTAYDGGRCAWRVLPWPELNFGNVPPGGGAILGFRFENAGADTCAVKDIHVSNDGGGRFTMPGGPLTGGVVPFDTAFSAMIGFSSQTPGTFEGELSITVNDPGTPVVRLPLRATSLSGCLTAAPNPVNFGPIRYDCAPEPRRTMISNSCPHPVTVDRVWVGEGTSAQYSLTDAPPLPQVLGPGEGFEVEVTYARSILGQHYSPLFVSTPSEPAPYLVPLWAETNHEGTAVDRFVQGQADQVDVLFVISNTTTMTPYQQRLQAALPGFVSSAESQGLSVQVGVTTTGLVKRPVCGGTVQGGEAGRLVPVGGERPRVIAATSGNLVALQQNLEVGACHNLVQGLETMRMALSPPLVDRTDDPRTPEPNDGNAGLLRPSARLAVILVADEDDHSGFGVASYVEFLRGIKGPNQSHRTQAFTLVPDGSCQTAAPEAPRLRRLAEDTGGVARSLCASSYDGLLQAVLSRAAGPQADFQLSFPLRDASEATVTVDGRVTSAWTFDPATNSVVFAPGSVPTSGQQVEVRYVSDCGTVTR